MPIIRQHNPIFGSGALGDVEIAADTEAVGIKQFRNLTVKAGFNLTAKRSRYGPLTLKVANLLTIEVGASINADGKGDTNNLNLWGVEWYGWGPAGGKDFCGDGSV